MTQRCRWCNQEIAEYLYGSTPPRSAGWHHVRALSDPRLPWECEWDGEPAIAMPTKDATELENLRIVNEAIRRHLGRG